ncbi:MAG: hypothetical protein CMA59_02530 [Euryarchaeota archaeon]|jgi:hypothetical protein|nr:hypothetical protein [Euryarchaeota archaeon]
MRNRSYSVVFIAILLMVCGISPSSSAQVLPDADLECDDSMEIDPSGFGNNLINCELTNPTAFPEKVDLTYQGGQLDIAGPESVTVGGGQTSSFQVALASPTGQSAGTYEVNVSAVVTEWNGVPVSIFGFSDEEGIEVEVLPYTTCSSSRPSAIFAEAGEDVSFSVVYSCDSNEDASMSISLHLLEKGSSQESMWPPGFNDMSANGCNIQNPMGSATCDFLLTTPSNLQEKWEGCLIVVDEMTDPGWSCSSDFAFPLTVNEKETVIPSVGIDVNGTVLEELGMTEENQNYFIAGGVGLVALVVALLVLMRRLSD